MVVILGTSSGFVTSAPSADPGGGLSNFDNTDNFTKEISQFLCKAVTGTTYAKRKHYTNADEFSLTLMSKIILNGIVPRLNYPDLQTRIITYPRKPLDKSNTLTEEKLEKIFQYFIKAL